MSKSRDIADSAATINYIDGLTSDAQTQLNAKVENLTDLGVTATSTELNYVDGVTSAIQTQIDGKEPADATILKDADIGSTVLGYVAPSTSGNILTSDGTNWTSAAPAGGGAWEVISSGHAINSSGLTLTWNASNYQIIKIYLQRLYVTADSTLQAQLGTSSSLITASDYDNINIVRTSTSLTASSDINASSMKLTGYDDIDRNDIVSAYTPGNFIEITLPLPVITSYPLAAPQAWKCEAIFGRGGDTNYPAFVQNMGFLDKTTDEYIIEQIKIYAPSTNFTCGYSIFGLKS